ncbi:hypothetical protein NEFER03_2002, partial [Nematocida sp. LUAm3]
LEKRKDVAKWFSRITYCQQESIDYRKLTAIQIISSVAEVNNVSLKEAKELLSRFSIEKNKNVSFKNLSGGEKRRILVICALLENKDLCIYDEPISGLDSNLAMLVLQSIKKTEKTSLISVHQPSPEIVSLFDHIIVMYNGTVIYSGACSDVIDFFSQINVNLVKENYFYLTYMVHLFGSDNHTEEDLKNKRNLDLFTESIMAQEISPHDSSQRNLFLVPIANTVTGKEAFSIIKTSFLFEKGFFGKSLIIELLGVCIWLAIACFFYSNGVASVSRKFGAVPNWSIFLSDAGKTKLTNLLTAKGAEYSDYYTYYLNVLLVNRNMYIGFLFSSMLIYILLVGDIYVSSNAYYVTLKKNIQKNSNTPLAYIFAMCVEVLLRKVFLLFLFQVIFFFYIAKFTNDSWMYNNSTISCLPLIAGMYILSFISGLIYICFQLLSINRKIRLFLISIFFSLFMDSGIMGYILDFLFKLVYTGLYSETIIYFQENSKVLKNILIPNAVTSQGIIDYIIESLFKIGTLVRKFQFLFMPHILMHMYGLKQKTIPYEIDSTLNYLPVDNAHLQKEDLDLDKHVAKEENNIKEIFLQRMVYYCELSYIKKDDPQTPKTDLTKVFLIILERKHPEFFESIEENKVDTSPHLIHLLTLRKNLDDISEEELDSIVKTNIPDSKEQKEYYNNCNNMADLLASSGTSFAYPTPFYFDGSTIKSVSFLDILWVPMKFLLPLSALFLLICFLKYRAIQPKLRC